MTDFKDRMKTELAELSERTEALGRFLDTETYKALSKGERDLLCEQHAAMVAYRDILQQRVDFHDNRPVHDEVG